MAPPSPRTYPIRCQAVALVGFMGAGKTTVGRALAERLGWTFVDLDARIEDHHGPIPALFGRGEKVFRDREAEALAAVPNDRVVLATGGGTVVRPANRALLHDRFHTVFLEVPATVCSARIRGSDRPLATQPGLFDVRAPLYDTARARVPADAPVEDVVDRVLATLVPHDEPVDGYQVRFRPDLDGFGIDLVDPICIADTTVDALYGPALQARIPSVRRYTFPAGEAHKTLDTWRDLLDRILAEGVHRDQVVIALGGGVSGDLAGFVAATLLRGLRWRLVPTTTLAMVDSSVGGKTGVDHPRGKNLIGAFHRPEEVWVAPSFLRTLPVEDQRAGMVEALKTGLVWSPALFELFEHLDVLAPDVCGLVLQSSIRAKAAIVRQDEHEGGLRRILNAGHTVGHALEAVCGIGALRHGEAVGIGLVLEARYGERIGVTTPGTADRICAALRTLGMPTMLPVGLDPDALVAATLLDKKTTRDTLRLPLLTAIGHAVEHALPKARIDQLFAEPPSSGHPRFP